MSRYQQIEFQINPNQQDYDGLNTDNCGDLYIINALIGIV